MSTIKLTNDVLIDVTSLKIGIDTSNKIATLASSNSGATYTAIQDCWCCPSMCAPNGDQSIQIDGVTLATTHSHNGLYIGIPLAIFLRKGQRIRYTSYNNGSVFGCK